MSTTSAALEAAQAWATTHGLLVGTPEGALAPVPFGLRPIPYPRAQFERAQALGRPYASLVAAVARDTAWLRSALAPVIGEGGDDFTRRLVALLDQAEAEGVAQPLGLGLLRSDYMLHAPPGTAPGQERLLQVELNTIASSFGCLSSNITDMHAFLRARGKALSAGVGELPHGNPAMATLARGLAVAHEAYAAGRRQPARALEVVFVVQPGERNAIDQYLLEQQLFTAHGVCVRRLTLAELASRCSLGDGRELLVGDECEVSVVYFRAGYTPRDYPSEEEWAGRALAERSLAIKCPNINFHLVGTKKVQQALAGPGELERFVPDADDAALLRASFAGLWALDDSVDVEAVKAMARANPEGYVLKPQREGGGNNFYGPDIVAQFDGMSAEELASYILMERILPQEHEGTLVRRGEVGEGPSICELGVYTCVLASSSSSSPSSEPHNETGGFLLRSKHVGVNEGGVAAGYAVLNCVALE